MSFIKSSADRNAELEAQLAEIENKNAAEISDKNEDANLSPEEKNWKKRHGDLRSHTARVENELRREIDGLKASLNTATKKTMDFPKSQEEVQAWAAKYPEIYDTIVTIARQNAIDVGKESFEKVQAIETREFESAKRIAKNELLSAHEDFPDIATTQDFNDWVDIQPRYIYDALFVNELDAMSAIRAIDLYKADRGIVKGKKTQKEQPVPASAAQRIPQGQNTNVNNGNAPAWTESKVASMKWSKLSEKQIQEIEESMQDPAFYDISGAAR